MELKFDKNRRRVKTCPCCGHDNKGGYVPYIGTDSGYCHYCGSSCFNDKNGTLVDLDKIKYSKPKKHNLMDEYFIEKSFTDHENIDLVKFLLGQLGTEITIEIIKEYYLCGSTKKPGAVIYWQIDRDKKIRTGKIMEYNPETGKRNGMVDWVHSYDKNYILKQCFFGEHLIEIGKPVAIVESEKAACLMSYFNPYFTWIASSGSNGLTKDKCRVLAGHKVVLFPDNGQYDTWRNKAMEMGLKCSVNTEVDKWFEQGLIDKGDAIDDYYLNGLKTLNEPVKIVDPEWNDWLKVNQHFVGPMGLSRN